MPAILSFILKKLLRMLILLAAAAILTFALVSLSPIDPLQANVGQAALGTLSAEQQAQLAAYWGADTPPLQRFWAWVGDFFRGDWGVSLLYRQPVWTVISQKLLDSLLPLTAAWLLSGLLGFGLGVAAAARAGSCWDKLLRGYALLTAATPTFCLAMLLLLLFAVWWPLLPIGLSVPIGMEATAVTWADRLRHALLPTAALTLLSLATMLLHTREKLLAVLHSDYVLFAQARGESKRAILWRHGLRNILLPALSLQFAALGEIVGGSILVEQVFSYPGLGQAAVAAALGSDLPLLLGITVLTSAVVFLGNLLADLLYTWADPRLRQEVSR